MYIDIWLNKTVYNNTFLKINTFIVMGIPDIDLCNYRSVTPNNLVFDSYILWCVCGGGGVEVFPVLLSFCYILPQIMCCLLAKRNV